MPPPAEKTSEQTPSATELPEEILATLVRIAPRAALWQWLNEDERAELRHDLTRGFQNTPNALRQPVVRARLMHHLQNDDDAFRQVLELWAGSTPPPAVLAAVRAAAANDLIARLPELWHQHGIEALVLALLAEDHEAALEALDGLAEQEQEQEPDTGETSEAAATEEGEESGTEEAAAHAAAWARLEAERDVWRRRADEATAAREQAQQEAAQARAQLQAQKREMQRRLRQETNRATAAAESLQDARKLLDRNLRRCKSTQREAEEAAAENKRMKRQLRRQQELSEELRKQIASLTAKLEAAQAAAAPPTALSETSPTESPEPAQEKAPPENAPPVAPARIAAPASPLDQIFLWRVAGRTFKMTPRDVKRAVDRNDEEFVFDLIQALDTLREENENGYRLFLDRVREFDRYYTRVLVTDTTRVLVDASNVARFAPDEYGRGQLRHLLAMRAELRRRDCFPIRIVADASLPYNIDEPAELQKLIKNGEVQITRSGQEADEVLAREARRTGAYVVTNDRTFHQKVSPDFEPLRITFRIYDDMLIVDEF